MFEVITKTNNRYTVEKIKHTATGIIFEYNGDMVFLQHENIASVNGNFNPVSAKIYLKKKWSNIKILTFTWFVDYNSQNFPFVQFILWIPSKKINIFISDVNWLSYFVR